MVDQALFYSSAYWLNKNKLYLKNELIEFQQQISEFEKLLDEVVSSDNFILQNNLESQILDFKRQVDNSLPIKEYLVQSKYTQLQCVTGSQDLVKDQYIEKQLSAKLNEARDQILKLAEKEIRLKVTKDMENDLKQAKKDYKKKLKEKYSDKIEQLEQNIAQKEERNKEILQKVAKIHDIGHNEAKKDLAIDDFGPEAAEKEKLKKLINSLEARYDELRDELDKAYEENKKKDTVIEKLKEDPITCSNKLGLENLKQLYYTVTNLKQPFNSEDAIQINYGNQTGKDTTALLSLFRLPAVKRLKIDRLEDGKILKAFFENSCPASLNLLSLNADDKSKLVKMEWFFDDLKKWFSVVSDEIYIQNFKVTSKELSSIIKSSSKCKKFVFKHCSIDSSEDLDFEIDTDYKIKKLGFID